MQLIFLPVMVGLMYVFLIRPQKQRVRSQQALVSQVQRGDRVMTASGLYGTVVAFEGEDRVVIEASPGVELTFNILAIRERIASGSSELGSDLEGGHIDITDTAGDTDAVDAADDADPVERGVEDARDRDA